MPETIAQGGTRGARFAALTAWWVASAADSFGLVASPDMTEIIEEQVKGLKLYAVIFGVFGTIGTALVMADFWSSYGVAGVLTGSTIVLLYAAWFAMSLVIGARASFMKYTEILLFAQGLSWGLFIYHIARASDASQNMFVIALSMAIVSTAMLATPITIALAFWIPAALGTEAAVLWGIHPFDPYMAYAAFPSYELFTLSGVIMINKALLGRSLARLDAKAKSETVGLLLRDYQENAADWLWSTDAEQNLRGVQGRFAEVLGSASAYAEGRHLAEVLGLEADKTGAAEELRASMIERRPFRDLTVKVRIDDENKWWCLSGKPVTDLDGRHAGYRGVGSDVTLTRSATEQTAYLASHDPLTGLANRRTFHARLDEACGTAGGPITAFALIMMDLDSFKEVNDVHGHGAGDQVLAIVGERLARDTQQGDVLARLGGDEFALLLPDTGPREACVRAQRLIEAVSHRIRVGDTWLSVGASIGIALFPEDGTSALNISRSADLALYRAKEEGRGVHRRFDPSLEERSQDRARLLADLRQAIDDEALSVEFQPIKNVRTRETTSMEALCRWQHPTRGDIPPSVFIPLAEECGLIGRLGQQVLLNACSIAVQWPSHVRVAVNLSTLQLKDTGLFEAVREVLAITGLEPERLELEITESALLRGDSCSREQLALIEEIGVRIVMDDFGTGFSCLSTLRSFRFHGLKVDAGFTRDVEMDPKAAAIVQLVAELASKLGIELTAEGIETEGQLELLRKFGVARAQGFLLGRPEPGHQAASCAGPGLGADAGHPPARVPRLSL